MDKYKAPPERRDVQVEVATATNYTISTRKKWQLLSFIFFIHFHHFRVVMLVFAPCPQTTIKTKTASHFPYHHIINTQTD
jgi:hypothetical protein